jgi:integrase
MLMNCFGLRPGEARRIRRVDLCTDSGTLRIPESKGHRNRLVMVPNDVLVLCRSYITALNRLAPAGKYLFSATLNHNECYGERWLWQTFSNCWAAAGLKYAGGPKVVPYDLRHSFATNRLYQWMKEGKDIEAHLPYLSAYMGHTKISHTAYYIHLVPKVFSHLTKQVLQRFEYLILEVDDIEE